LRAADLGACHPQGRPSWTGHPVLLLVNAAASIPTPLRPAGLSERRRRISTSFLKEQ